MTVDRLREGIMLDRRVALAHSRGDALEYHNAVTEAGLEPGDPLLFEIGAAEAMFQQNRALNIMAISRLPVSELTKLERYRRFYREASRISSSNEEADTCLRRSLLNTYFPFRFGPDGKQPIDQYEDHGVKTVFEGVMQSARAYIARHSPDPFFTRQGSA